MTTNTVTFGPEPEVAECLEKLCLITNLDPSELINTLLASSLSQTIENNDSGLLQWLIRSFAYDTKEEALAVIAGYEGFISEPNAAGVYHDDARPARTRDGHWEILFKSTHRSMKEQLTNEGSR